MVTGSEIALAGLAAILAGFINAIAGGGSLISFPALIALGIPEVSANVTNTVALCPGYFGGAIAQKSELHGQARRLGLLITAGIIGGLFGAYLLLNVSKGIFHAIVPILILMASGLLAIQNRVRKWIKNYSANGKSVTKIKRGIFFPITISAIYGGYFGAGLSVIVLAVLGVFYDDSLTRLNAFKQCISFSINVAAAVVFIFSGMVVWSLAIVMAIGALAGGIIGGNVSERVNPEHLRWLVVIVGLAIGIALLVQH
jgi:uncharacterized membrane protein YfcA